ncbi:hypothetical protein OL548_25960 [Lysinibacillus sp. MHQ-1]|nr:hypothetical protein OL548_25960 [Lysinibacillus sp. MHQ-1]
MADILQKQEAFYQLKVWRELLYIWEVMLTQSLLTEEIVDPSIIVQQERAKAMLNFFTYTLSAKK